MGRGERGKDKGFWHKGFWPFAVAGQVDTIAWVP
jgi:hypothetical protein